MLLLFCHRGRFTRSMAAEGRRGLLSPKFQVAGLLLGSIGNLWKSLPPDSSHMASVEMIYRLLYSNLKINAPI